uniref:C3/C5 convertase n=1 Tax=Sphaeramia orbicularis TaxID=375764 RepID=A0A673BHI3_9TELE
KQLISNPVMFVRFILWILLVSVLRVSLQQEEYDYGDETYDDPQPLNCSTTESIRGGHVSYSQGGLEGSVLTYHCRPGQYPFPVSLRVCDAHGEWSPMRLTSGRLVTRATCKDVLCPGQLQLDHGDLWPRDQWFKVGSVQSFSCEEGFTLHGSAQRNCTLSGEWTGTIPVCDNHDGDCDDPGTPPGAHRSAGQLHTGEKVIYRCQSGLDLLGSDERVCLENREWSGSPPRCQSPYTFDSPSTVAAAMAGSLAGVMDVLTPDSIKKGWCSLTFGRSFRVSEGSRMNVFILLDTSGSIKKKDFELSRNATIALIRKLDSYEVQIRYHVLSFASESKDITDIRRTVESGNAEHVIWNLEQFDYHSHGQKTGTNIYSALIRVYELISFFKQNRHRNHFNETQNVIVLQTDGYSNVGSKPAAALARIRNILGYSSTATDHTNERLLDVYVFGIGEQVKKDELNSLASKKSDENHVFIVQSYSVLGQIFNSIISDKTVTMCGVAQEDVTEEEQEGYTKPWHVTLPGKCAGSIVSQNWVLTSAHCFGRVGTDQVPQQVEIKYGRAGVEYKFIMHPRFNVNALKRRNVSEFYDYDVALVRLNKSLPLSWKARPICLPCTVPASRAMKRIDSTCLQHKEELLPYKQTPAFFIHKTTNGQVRKDTHIHTDTQRAACVEKARQTLKPPTDVTLEEYVPDRFLCSGGTSGKQDAITCQGDSGGPLFLQKRKRYFQVGVVSWGTTDVCKTPIIGHRRYSSDRPPADARDFHIDVFKIMPWLKTHLGREIQFLPDDD